MIANSVHFGCGFPFELETFDLKRGGGMSAFAVKANYYSNEVTLLFPTREIRDAVRDALLKCPGCVARPEAEAVPAPCALCSHPSHEGRCQHHAPNPQFTCGCPGECEHGKHPHYCRQCTAAPPQPAVQAMDATEDWF